jgi:hypothetical protein
MPHIYTDSILPIEGYNIHIYLTLFPLLLSTHQWTLSSCPGTSAWLFGVSLTQNAQLIAYTLLDFVSSNGNRNANMTWPRTTQKSAQKIRKTNTRKIWKPKSVPPHHTVWCAVASCYMVWSWIDFTMRPPTRTYDLCEVTQCASMVRRAKTKKKKGNPNLYFVIYLLGWVVFNEMQNKA